MTFVCFAEAEIRKFFIRKAGQTGETYILMLRCSSTSGAIAAAVKRWNDVMA